MSASPIISLAAIAAFTVGCPGCSRSSVVPRSWQSPASIEKSTELPASSFKSIPEERFSFQVSALGFNAGELVMAAGKPGTVDGRNVIFYSSRAKTTGIIALLKTVTDTVQSWIDLETGLPVYHHIDSLTRSKFGGKAKREGVEIKFGPSPFNVHEWYGDQHINQEQTLPKGARVYDLTSALLAMRGWDAKKGDRASFFVLRSTLFWEVQVEHAGESSVKTNLGRFAAVRLDGVTRRYQRDGTLEAGKQARHFSIWYSDDELRVPLKIAAKTDIGDVKMELIEYVGAGREIASAP